MDKTASHSDGEIMLSPKLRRKTNVEKTSLNHVNLSFSQDGLPFSGIPPAKTNIEITAYSGRKSPKQWRESLSSQLSTSTSALQGSTGKYFNPRSNNVTHVTKKIHGDRGKPSFNSKKLRPPVNGVIPSIQIQDLQSFNSTDLG